MDPRTINRFKDIILDEINIRKNLSEELKQLFETLLKGNKNYTQFQEHIYKRFEEGWIVGLETFFPSLQKIISDIKVNLKSDEEILPIEKSRRTTNESIRHLLRNTRYIKEVTEEGDIIPEKVLNALQDIGYGSYENRFIMTLIDRLFMFLSERIKVLKENLFGSRKTVYNLENNFKVNAIDLSFDFEVNANEPLELTDQDIVNHRIYYRMENAYKFVSTLYNSDFMSTMKRYKKVNPPILKTQIILKNPDFRQAYLLWLYLDELHEFKYDVVRETKTKDITPQYKEDINHTLFLLLLTLFTETNFGSDIGQNEKVNEQVYRAKRNLDDYLSNVTFEDLDVYDFDLQLPSQFYIEKMRESAQERFTKLEPNKNKPTQNFKKILFDQYSIGDAVYNYFFEVNQDQDVFDYLITEKHPVLKYQKANEKYQIVKAAREVKERMLDEQTKLEQTWIEKIAELKNEAIKYLEETIHKEHDQILMDEEERMLEELKVLEYKLNKE